MTKPTKLKLLEGNPGKRSLPVNEPDPVAKEPKIPKDIDKEAVIVWKRLAPQMVKLGLLAETDGDAFAILCQCRSRLVQIHTFLKKHNASFVQEKSVVDSTGTEHKEYKVSPYITMEKHYYQLFNMYATHFGLTPKGRVGLAVNSGKKEKDEFFED
jgi:P27 family predicted phage terminase small subunit